MTQCSTNVTVVVEHCRSGQLAGVAAARHGRSIVQNISPAGFDAAIAALPGVPAHAP
jgi:hypothetical protein